MLSRQSNSRVFVFNWTYADMPLAKAILEALRRRIGDHAGVVCLGAVPRVNVPREDTREWDSLNIDYYPLPSLTAGNETLVSALRAWPLPAAEAIVVLPARDREDPDSRSRMLCAALRQAFGDALPHMVVELVDQDARSELGHLGISTVFSAGMLEATMMAHACVDRGVYEFLSTLMRGDCRIRSRPIPSQLLGRRFRDAVLELCEVDGTPVTVVGMQSRGATETETRPILNPAHTTQLSPGYELLVLEGSI